MNIEETARTVRGAVKWFDPAKGFGFVVAEEGGANILLHANVLRNFGQNSVAEGAVIEILSQETDRGLQAVEVLSVDPPRHADRPALPDLEDFDLDQLDQVVLQPARVKWFDKGKGFGFANVFGSDADIFVHVEVLRRSGLADLAPGEALALRVIDGKRGLMAIEVSAWEAAIH